MRQEWDQLLGLGDCRGVTAPLAGTRGRWGPGDGDALARATVGWQGAPFPPPGPLAQRGSCAPHSGPGRRSLDNWIRGSETPAASSEAKQLTEGAGPRVPPLGVRRRLGPCSRSRVLQASSLGALVGPGRPSAGERPSRLADASVHPFWVGDTSLL